MRFLNSVTVPKNVKGGPFCDFLTSIVLQNIETNEGGTLWCNPKNFKKSRIVPKKSGTKVGSLDVCFVFSFRFGRASEVGVWSCWGLKLLNKWTKKWTLRVLKKLPTVIFGHIFYQNAPTNKTTTTVGALLKAQKAQTFKTTLRAFLSEIYQS